MKAYFANMSMTRCLLLTIPALAIVYPLVMVVVPAVFRAVTPQVVRTVLSLI
jgi:branched-subunit amino acid permease